MPWPNFCNGCGAPAPVPPSSLRARLRVIVRGCHCTECTAKIAGPAWGAGFTGLFIGGIAVFSVGVWQASTAPPPPLPALTVQNVSRLNAPSSSLAASGPQEISSISNENHRCGAATKSGRPCRRLVRGKTGYCWQHRKD